MEVASNALYTCTECGDVHETKNALFKHLESHGVVRVTSKRARAEKLVLTVGWISQFCDDEEGWLKDATLSAAWTVQMQLENSIAKALHVMDGKNEDEAVEPLKAATRAAGCAQRANYLLSMEATAHSTGDILCLQYNRNYTSTDHEWLTALNQQLPQHICVMSVNALTKSAATEFHAEEKCSQRRYEFLLPLNALKMAPELHERVAAEYVVDEKVVRSKNTVWSTMELEYSAADLQQPLHYYRRLKAIFKHFANTRNYHNFVTGGSVPSDNITHRKVARVYHKDLLRIDGDLYMVFSISGDTFLRGQVRKMLGLALAVYHDWLPMSCMEDVFFETVITDIPSTPGFPLYLAECKYDKFEAKFGIHMDPRRSPNTADKTRFTAWEQQVQSHIVQQYKQRGVDWLQEIKRASGVMQQRLEREKNIIQRATSGELLRMHKEMVYDAAPSAYANVLRLLRAADSSGLWPPSSTGRQKVVQDDSLVENGGRGGSFSIGVLPAPLATPKGNELFPDLLKACFLLEKIIAPHRPPSSTIAVNRHAVFLPHRDTGAGSGQTKSLIVALGDFVGGEIVIECEPHDIRYAPVEFDGWGQRHWNMPFEGERFSLVWFTPLGVNVPGDLWWLNDLEQ